VFLLRFGDPVPTGTEKEPPPLSTQRINNRWDIPRANANTGMLPRRSGAYYLGCVARVSLEQGDFDTEYLGAQGAAIKEAATDLHAEFIRRWS
jgi:hypothetical protein